MLRADRFEVSSITALARAAARAAAWRAGAAVAALEVGAQRPGGVRQRRDRLRRLGDRGQRVDGRAVAVRQRRGDVLQGCGQPVERRAGALAHQPQRVRRQEERPYGERDAAADERVVEAVEVEAAVRRLRRPTGGSGVPSR
jgi:hypothetical protein